VTADPARPFVANDPHDPPRPAIPAARCAMCRADDGRRLTRYGAGLICGECRQGLPHWAILSEPQLPATLGKALADVRDYTAAAHEALVDHAAIAKAWSDLPDEAKVAIANLVDDHQAQPHDLVSALMTVAGRYGKWSDR